VLACDEKDEVVACRMERQALARPIVRERPGAERGAMDFAELGREWQWIDCLDYGRGWSVAS
jgi:hypothetical protein